MSYHISDQSAEMKNENNKNYKWQQSNLTFK
jgi:hypothetical protein